MTSMASNFKFDLRIEINNLNYPTLVSICMLPLTGILVAFEAMVAFK